MDRELLAADAARRGRLGRRRAAGLPGIAVLPYFSIGDEIIRKDFTLALTERITATLSRFHDLHVTSLGSVLNFTVKDPVAEIGRKLGVEYLLRGQVVRDDQQLSFTHLLYDAETGQELLRFSQESGLGDLLSLERVIITHVVARILGPLRETEIERVLKKSPASSTGYELTVRAQLALHQMTRKDCTRADRYLTRALQLAPEHADAHAWRARYHSIRIGQGWTDNRQQEAELAMLAAARAVELDDQNALALSVLGHMRSFLLKDCVNAEKMLRLAVACSPNEPTAHMFLGATLSYLGRGLEAREHAEFALSLSPEDSCLYSLLFFACLACYIEGDYEQAAEYAEQSLALNPKYSTTVKLMTVIQVARGRLADARRMGALLRELEPGFHQIYPPYTPLVEGPHRDAYFQRLRTAGCFDIRPLGPSRRRATAR